MSLKLKDPNTSKTPPMEGGQGVICSLPTGGDKDKDKRFMDWLQSDVPESNGWILDQLVEKGVTSVREERLLTPFRFMNHMYKYLTGLEFPSGAGPNYSHKVRFVAIQYHYRPDEFEAELRLYSRRIVNELGEK